uniref:hypothetical protein n=1 Tax=Flavobacterium sp. TaxID=239 RepID=UPI00404A5BC3
MEIKPKIGVNNLKFGMTRKEVIEILNEPDRILTNEDDENELILEWNSHKLRLTFYKNEDDRFGYLRTINPELKFKGIKVIGTALEIVKNQIFADLTSGWEMEDYGFFTTHFNEENWLTLYEEYGVLINLELGVPFKNDEDYKWPI